MRLIAAVLLFSFVSLSHAQPLDHAALEAYVDGMVQAKMEDDRIPGVVISVVHGGVLIFEKGYGFAREPERVPADPATSLFRVASISKTFNATALMQLVEQGHVDLDADFTTYLPDIDFDLPRGTVRVRDLITHSAGFEDSYFGHFWALDEASDHELEPYVRRYQPAQVRAPGELVVYSNYGTAVAGLIVERLSGMPYADYMEQNVLRPLGMERSTFRDWPGEARDGYLPPELEPDLAHPATWSGVYKAPRWAWAHRGMTPAGALLSTAREMSYFMRAHLGDGSFEGGRILNPETVTRMHIPLIRNHDAVAANAHGFWVNNAWGYATLEHGGAIFGFMSNMVLVPELDLGIFISTNSPPGYALISALPRRIIGRFFERRLEIPAPGGADALTEYDGRYLPLRRGHTTIDKLAADSILVAHSEQGYLTIAAGSGTQRYAPLGDDVFINTETGETIAFGRDADGRPHRVYNAYGSNAYERIGLARSENAAPAAAVMVIVALVLWLLALGMTRHHRIAESAAERNARRLAHTTALTWVVFFVALAASMSGVYGLTARHFAHFPQGIDWAWIIAGPVGAALTALMLYYTIAVWRDAHWYWTRRITYTLFVLASVALVLALHDWKLLGLRVL
ncbi:MAG: beta-lactamase family protein [Xanthomonadaceae bacterium]|nr:beta-lactamase family protein [Xanthomonadaceae bacterium]